MNNAACYTGQANNVGAWAVIFVRERRITRLKMESIDAGWEGSVRIIVNAIRAVHLIIQC